MFVPTGGQLMNAKSFRRLLVVLGTVFILVMSFTPAAFAGEDGCDDDEECGGGGGGGGAQVYSGGGTSDTGFASGGVQTGAGGMASVRPDGSMLLPFALAGGGALVLTAAGGVALRRQNNQ
jgi:hypothetical protein